jgi:hypothetical protein
MLNSDTMYIEGAQVIPYSIFLDKLVRKRTAHLLEACTKDIQEAKEAIRDVLRAKLTAAGYSVTEQELQ